MQFSEQILKMVSFLYLHNNNKSHNTFILRFLITAIVGFSCSFRIIRGEKYNPLLKLSTSMAFREKERKFQNIVNKIFWNFLRLNTIEVQFVKDTIFYSFQFELLFRRSVLGSSYKQTTIEKFENGTLKIFFRLYLDRRKIPRSIINVEDIIEDIIVKETYSMSSLFKDMEVDLKSVSVKSK